MNLKTINVMMFLTGVILTYSGIKGYQPQSVLAWSLGGPKPTGWGPKKKDVGGPYGGQLGGGPGNPTTGGNGVAPGDHPGDMPWTYPPGDNTSSASVTNPVAGGDVYV